MSLRRAARLRARAEVSKREAVRYLGEEVRAHAHLGPTEIMRRLEEYGWSISYSQVNNLLRGRTR